MLPERATACDQRKGHGIDAAKSQVTPGGVLGDPRDDAGGRGVVTVPSIPTDPSRATWTSSVLTH
jgi:hypothetical protein